METHLLDILQHAHCLSSEQTAQVRTYMAEQQCRPALAIVQLHLLSARELQQQLAEHFHLPAVHLSTTDYRGVNEKLGLRNLVLKHHALPVKQEEHTCYLAVDDPSQPQMEEEFRFATGLSLQLMIAQTSELHTCIRDLYGRAVLTPDAPLTADLTADDFDQIIEQQTSPAQAEDPSDQQAPMNRLVQQIILDAISKKASDIHFEPYEQYYRIRLRCDGLLIESNHPVQSLAKPLTARIKVMAKLDLAQKRLPQDGRIKLNFSAEQAIDVRVSTIPTLWGEKIVMRLLHHTKMLSLDQLGLQPEQYSNYLHSLKQPQGMILVTGPTGSGKTASLYAGLQAIDQQSKNISTIEDPVEMNITGINQMNIQTNIGLTFPVCLRALLRQDPDVIMLGEIRDKESADIAIKAAQTGHLVLSTLHTNSAIETLYRLHNMGIALYHLLSSISLIISQRLIRLLCSHCKKVSPLTRSQLHQLQLLQHLKPLKASSAIEPELTESKLLPASASLPKAKWETHPTACTSMDPQQQPPSTPAMQPTTEQSAVMKPAIFTEAIFAANTAGCSQCIQGYAGRQAIYEVLPIDAGFSEEILNHPEQLTPSLSLPDELLTLKDSGLQLLLQGKTSLQELQRILEF